MPDISQRKQSAGLIHYEVETDQPATAGANADPSNEALRKEMWKNAFDIYGIRGVLAQLGGKI